MDYVMVPVPEEHVVDVMLHVARLVARASVVPWTDEAVVELFDEVDEASRSLLGLVARSAAAGKEVHDEEAADALELNVREVRELVRLLDDVCARGNRESILSVRDATVVLRNGRSVQRRVYVMADSVTRAIRAHERQTLGDGKRPPTDSVE